MRKRTVFVILIVLGASGVVARDVRSIARSLCYEEFTAPRPHSFLNSGIGVEYPLKRLRKRFAWLPGPETIFPSQVCFACLNGRGPCSNDEPIARVIEKYEDAGGGTPYGEQRVEHVPTDWQCVCPHESHSADPRGPRLLCSHCRDGKHGWCRRQVGQRREHLICSCPDLSHTHCRACVRGDHGCEFHKRQVNSVVPCECDDPLDHHCRACVSGAHKQCWGFGCVCFETAELAATHRRGPTVSAADLRNVHRIRAREREYFPARVRLRFGNDAVVRFLDDLYGLDPVRLSPEVIGRLQRWFGARNGVESSQLLMIGVDGTPTPIRIVRARNTSPEVHELTLLSSRELIEKIRENSSALVLAPMPSQPPMPR